MSHVRRTLGTIDMPIGDAKYFLEQAERCFRLARCITDRDATGKLQALGREFMNRAAALDAEREAENRRFSMRTS